MGYGFPLRGNDGDPDGGEVLAFIDSRLRGNDDVIFIVIYG